MRDSGLKYYASAYLLFLYAPLFIIPLFSFNDSPIVTFPLSGFTFKWYAEIASDDRLVTSTLNSFMVAVPVSIIATILGTCAAKGLTRNALPLRAQILAMITTPLLVPTLLLGIGMLVVLHTFLKIPLSLVTIGIGHTLLCTPFATLTMLSTLEGMDPSLEEASIDLGKNNWETFWLVTAPLAAPGFAASFLLCLMISLDEFLVAYFLSGNQMTLPIYIFSELRFPERLPVLLAMATCMLVLTTVLLGAVSYLRNRK